jgi:hypothetical protein
LVKAPSFGIASVAIRLPRSASRDVLQFYRTSVAVRSALQELSPLVEASRRRLGHIPETCWSEPYLIGLIMTLITLHAQRRHGGRLASNELGYVQLHAWRKLTGMPDDSIGEDLCRLSADGDLMFQWGCRRAGRLFAAWHWSDPGLAFSDEAIAEEISAPRSIGELWKRYFDDRVADVAN